MRSSFELEVVKKLGKFNNWSYLFFFFNIEGRKIKVG